MTPTRRSFLAGSAATAFAINTDAAPPPKDAVSKAQLDQILDAPVLHLDFLANPVTVASVELLKNGKNYLLRARSTDGVEAITVPNPSRMADCWPLFLRKVLPVFLKKDARTLETLLWDVYRFDSNYKYQGLSLFDAVASIEMAFLELMAQTAQRPLADFFGGRLRTDVPIYVASGVRGNKPEEEIDHLQKIVADSGAKALKFRLGGRMSHNADSLPGRTEALIPLVRKTFGDAFTLYADANSSYDVPNAIRIGKLMEEHQYAFYEEPVPFDEIWECKQVADALQIPIALGEQEFSFRRFQWVIQNRAAHVIQPDLHYFGGYVRCTKVARMAAAAGLTVVPHMSGEGLGYLDVVHFASFTPNVGPFMEFKGNTPLPIECPTSSLKSENGIVRCPTGVGFGIKVDPAFVKAAKPVTLQ